MPVCARMRMLICGAWLPLRVCVHQAIPDVFLGAFDSRATLVDTKSGQTVPTQDAIFILTSNYGADEVILLYLGLPHLERFSLAAA